MGVYFLWSQDMAAAAVLAAVSAAVAEAAEEAVARLFPLPFR